MSSKIFLTLLWASYKLVVLLVASQAFAVELAPSRSGLLNKSPILAPEARFSDTKTKVWKWSPNAEHHRAVVTVIANGSSGSGVYFATDKIAGILTAFHVVDGKGPYKVIWPDGRVDVSTKRIPDKKGNEVNDLAVVFLPKLRTDVKPLPISSRDTYAGERLEVLGYGGPGRDVGDNTLRHFWVIQSDRKFEGHRMATPGPMHGDSGGPILSFQNGEPHVISVCKSGSSKTNKKQKMPGGTASWYDDVFYCAPGRTVAFVERLEDQFFSDTSEAAFRNRGKGYVPRICPPGGCKPKPKPDGGGGGDYELYPPDGFGQQEQQAEITPPQEEGAGAAGPILFVLALIAAAVVGFHKRAFG